MVSVKAALLSVIIPVYNVEPYLEQCLDSVINQTYKNLEIICIDDGSTDNSLKILEKFQKKDKRIKLIKQQNQGASVARNAGLDIATGEYIAFVDSDDYLELNAYEECMNIMLRNSNIELIEFDMRAFADHNCEISCKRAKHRNVRHSRNIDLMRLSIYLCDKIYKRSILDKYHIRFIPKLIYEDVFFSYAYMLSMKNVLFLKRQLYNYRIRKDSTTGDDYHLGGTNRLQVYNNLDAVVDYAKYNNIYAKNKHFIFKEYVSNI